MPAPWYLPPTIPAPEQKLGCKSPRVVANFLCNSPGVLGGGIVMAKIDSCKRGQSIPSQLASPSKFFKNRQIPAPQANILCQMLGETFPGSLILINFTLFAVFKISIINLPIETVQIRREDRDLSMKNM